MKMLLATVAVAATVVASPAFAQTTNGWQSNGRNPYAAYSAPYADTFAYSNGYRNNRRHSSSSSFDVYDTSGRYVGSDPDPTIRDMLARDPSYSD
jgi:hypothetical protein